MGDVDDDRPVLKSDRRTWIVEGLGGRIDLIRGRWIDFDCSLWGWGELGIRGARDGLVLHLGTSQWVLTNEWNA
jgi:hypothetical protein